MICNLFVFIFSSWKSIHHQFSFSFIYNLLKLKIYYINLFTLLEFCKNLTGYFQQNHSWYIKTNVHLLINSFWEWFISHKENTTMNIKIIQWNQMNCNTHILCCWMVNFGDKFRNLASFATILVAKYMFLNFEKRNMHNGNFLNFRHLEVHHHISHYHDEKV